MERICIQFQTSQKSLSFCGDVKSVGAAEKSTLAQEFISQGDRKNTSEMVIARACEAYLGQRGSCGVMSQCSQGLDRRGHVTVLQAKQPLPPQSLRSDQAARQKVLKSVPSFSSGEDIGKRARVQSRSSKASQRATLTASLRFCIMIPNTKVSWHKRYFRSMLASGMNKFSVLSQRAAVVLCAMVHLVQLPCTAKSAVPAKGYMEWHCGGPIAEVVRTIHLTKIPGEAQKQWIVLRYSQSHQNEHPVPAEALRCFAANRCDKALKAEIEFQYFSEQEAIGTYRIEYADGHECTGTFVVKSRQKFHGVCI
jgi:hypothetical protein